MDEIEREELEVARRRIEERRAAAAAEVARLEASKTDVELLTAQEFDQRLRSRYGFGSVSLASRPAPPRLAELATDDSPAAFQVRLQAVHDAGANPPTPVPRAEGGDAYREHPEVYRRRLASIGVSAPEPSPYAVAKWEREEAARQSRESAERERALIGEIKGMRAELAKLAEVPPAPAAPTERDLNRAAFYRRAKSRAFSVEE